jgi:predicted transposase/invertase (TIGR01784 family)
MARYLDPKADVVFKKVFGDHPHLLKSFLNAVLPLSPGHEIVELEHLPNEQVPKIPTMKRTIADVRCRDAKGRIFIVEMQIQWTDSFKQRLLFEAGQALVKQLDAGEEYNLLQPVYGLGIVAEAFNPTPQWYHHFKLVNIERPDHLGQETIEHLQLVFVELQKFPIHSTEEKRLRLLWLRFMREINAKTREVSPELLEVPEINEAIRLVEESAFTPGELQAYESYWNAVSTEKTLLVGRFEEGREKGRAEGLEEGRAEGLEEGRAEGRAEERMAVARQLLASGVDVATVISCTGLSVKEVEMLR